MSGDELHSWAIRSGRPASGPAAAAGAQRPIAAPVVIDHDNAYRAFSAGMPQQTMLEIRQQALGGESGVGMMLPLHYLMRVTYAHSPLGDHITLAFADCLITVHGRHLEELRRDLANGKVGLIQEYDPARWPEQPDSSEPVILSIEVIAPGSAGGRT